MTPGIRRDANSCVNSLGTFSFAPHHLFNLPENDAGGFILLVPDLVHQPLKGPSAPTSAAKGCDEMLLLDAFGMTAPIFQKTESCTKTC